MAGRATGASYIPRTPFAMPPTIGRAQSLSLVGKRDPCWRPTRRIGRLLDSLPHGGTTSAGICRASRERGADVLVAGRAGPARYAMKILAASAYAERPKGSQISATQNGRLLVARPGRFRPDDRVVKTVSSRRGLSTSRCARLLTNRPVRRAARRRDLRRQRRVESHALSGAGSASGESGPGDIVEMSISARPATSALSGTASRSIGRRSLWRGLVCPHQVARHAP